MASFAKIGLNSKVIEVHSVHNDVLKDADGVEQESLGVDFLTKLLGWALWKQTSYNGNIRKNHAGVGYTYDEVRDAFIPPQPYPSWTVAHPDDGKLHIWDEENTQWVEVE